MIHLLEMKNLALLLSLAMRIAFETYWGAAAKLASPAAYSESQKSRQIHLILVNVAFVLLYIRVPGLDQQLLPHTFLISTVGLVIQAAFTVLAVWSRQHLGINWSGEIAIKVDHRLVQSGPYRWVRHPIYAGILGMSVGTAIVSGESHAVLGLVVVSLAYWRKIRLEEINLSKAFGPEYDAYCRRSSALIPKLL